MSASNRPGAHHYRNGVDDSAEWKARYEAMLVQRDAQFDAAEAARSDAAAAEARLAQVEVLLLQAVARALEAEVRAEAAEARLSEVEAELAHERAGRVHAESQSTHQAVMVAVARARAAEDALALRTAELKHHAARAEKAELELATWKAAAVGASGDALEAVAVEFEAKWRPWDTFTIADMCAWLRSRANAQPAAEALCRCAGHESCGDCDDTCPCYPTGTPS